MQISGRIYLHFRSGSCSFASQLFLCEHREGKGTQVAAPLEAFKLFLKFLVFLVFWWESVDFQCTADGQHQLRETNQEQSNGHI